MYLQYSATNGSILSDPRTNIIKLLSCILIFVLLLSACNTNESKYYREGIGSNLYSSDMRAASRDLEIYFGFLCHQTNFATSLGSDQYPRCVYPSSGSHGWSLLVQTGFNDIDRRCDGYLAWIEEARHRERFGRSQMGHIGQLANTIARASNASATGVTLVAAAFGYAKSLFDDYHDLIYLGIEDSTIKTIVTQRRNDFRKQFAAARIGNKPNAVHVLRSYMRICMPYTITMDVNTYARAIAVDSLPPSFENASKVKEGLIVSSQPLVANTQVNTARVRNRITAPGWESVSSEEFIDDPTARAIQRALCFDGSNIDGQFGPKTELSLKIFKAVYNGRPSSSQWDDERSILSMQEIGALRGASDRQGRCARGSRNYLEASLSDQQFAEIAAALGAPEVKLFSDLRAKIKQYRQSKGYNNGPDGFLAEQFTPDMFEDLGLGFSAN